VSQARAITITRPAVAWWDLTDMFPSFNVQADPGGGVVSLARGNDPVSTRAARAGGPAQS